LFATLLVSRNTWEIWSNSWNLNYLLKIIDSIFSFIVKKKKTHETTELRPVVWESIHGNEMYPILYNVAARKKWLWHRYLTLIPAMQYHKFWDHDFWKATFLVNFRLSSFKVVHCPVHPPFLHKLEVHVHLQ
jgi:hypothetical protein